MMDFVLKIMDLMLACGGGCTAHAWMFYQVGPPLTAHHNVIRNTRPRDCLRFQNSAVRPTEPGEQMATMQVSFIRVLLEFYWKRRFFNRKCG